MSSQNYRPYYIHPKDMDDPAVMAVIAAHFDHQTDLEEEEILRAKLQVRHQLSIESHARKLCFVRVLSFPVDLLLNIAIFGPGVVPRKFRMVTDMVRFIAKKISYREFIQSLEKNA